MARMGFTSSQKGNLSKTIEIENDPPWKQDSKNKKNLQLNPMEDAPKIKKKLRGESVEMREKCLSSIKPNYPEFPCFGKKLNFRCQNEDRKRRAEIRRKKIIRKLKSNYEINVEGLNENVANEIIRKIESIEKEKKEREKRNVERTLFMVTRLLEEQKYKRRGLKFSGPTWRKKRKPTTTTKMTIVTSGRLEDDTSKSEKNEEIGENDSTISFRKEPEKSSTFPEINAEESIFRQREVNRRFHKIILKKDVEGIKAEEKMDEIESSALLTSSPRSLHSVPLEKSLECNPKRIIFQDYKRGEVYLQVLKITNISLEMIHCRYLGIVVHVKHEERFPIGVAVRDSVKLRPGLSCSTKVRFCSQNEDNELEYSIVYETRRKNKPLMHSFFFVPLSCIPARAIVRISPLKIKFPSLTWCEATGPEGSKSLTKIIKIENTGGKECFCRIVRETNNARREEEQEVEEAEEIFGEVDEEEERELLGSYSTNFPRTEITDSYASVKSFRDVEEGENGYLLSREESLDVAEILKTELIENVFATFRFSEKYHISIPPHSTKRLEVRFIPEYKGFHQEIHLVQFENCYNSSEETIELTGDIKKLPLFAEPQMIDLKTCVANSGVYSADFTIFNTSKGPHSISLKIPLSMRNHAHVHPKGTIIQASSSCQFFLKFYPKLTLNRDADRYFDEELRVLEFPIFVYSANAGNCKSDYIKIYVFAVITDYSLELSPGKIDFGSVSTSETVRTRINLTNLTLATQEYGFLNLPKGVRVEPNFGFGRILPMETIHLYLLYSPGSDLVNRDNRKETENHSFQVKVTSVAECGGFGEEETKSFESIWFQKEKFFPYEGMSIIQEEDEEGNWEENVHGENSIEEYGECHESGSFFDDDEDDGEVGKLAGKKLMEETKIRDYLKAEAETVSEDSLFKRIDLKNVETGNENKKGSSFKLSRSVFDDDDDDEEEEEEAEEDNGGHEIHQMYDGRISRFRIDTILCDAFVRRTFCQLSESVIQLPSTPFSSFSLYRFRLNGYNGFSSGPEGCCRGSTVKANKRKGSQSFDACFQFHFDSPHIKLEPRSGFFRSGESVPVTIVYRPEFSPDEICRESRMQKARKMAIERAAKMETISTAQPKGKKKSPVRTKMSTEAKNPNEFEEETIDLDKLDFFEAEKNLQETSNPFRTEVKIDCVVKMIFVGEGETERIESHRLIVICPAVKPKFVYLGNSQEINFDRVFVGTTERILVEIQNVSLDRIRPAMSLLNPNGPFSCLSGLRDVSVDPEHVWSQPLTYSPTEIRGHEKEYFEIYCGTTNICLMAKGEAIWPNYKMTPNFACCFVESKFDSYEEIKMDVENANPIKFRLGFVVDFAGESLDFGESEGNPVEIRQSGKREKVDSVEGKKMRKKTESERRNFVKFWEEIPETILSDVNGFDFVEPEVSKNIFRLVGTDEKNELIVPPFGKSSIKICFAPPSGENVSYKKYAVKYKIMLEGTILLKEILIVCATSKSNRN